MVAIDAKARGPGWEVSSHGGTRPTGRDLIEWAREAVDRGAGEILLTSMDDDGTGNGFAVEMLRAVTAAVPAGPACHTGARSCFVAGDPLLDAPPSPGETLVALERVLRSRRQAAPEGSYSAKLFADEALRHKKVGEEAAELVVASLRGKPDEIAHEAADLLYHALVLLQSHGITLQDVTDVLRSREGKRRG